MHIILVTGISYQFLPTMHIFLFYALSPVIWIALFLIIFPDALLQTSFKTI